MDENFEEIDETKPISGAKVFGLMMIFLVAFLLAFGLVFHDKIFAPEPELNITAEQRLCLKENVMFFGTTWCKYCNTQKEILDLDLVSSIYYDCSKSPALCSEFKVSRLPTHIIGENKTKYVGVKTIDNLLNLSNCN
jgi:hypothetical protein